MKRILKKLAIVSYLRRKRVRAGFGVHSPNRYYYIRQILYQRGMFYAYETLPESNVIRTSMLKLLFRVANDCQANRALIISKSDERAKLISQYLESGKRGIVCQIASNVEEVDNSFWSSDVATLVFVDEDLLTDISWGGQLTTWMAIAAENSTCVCDGIHLSDKHEFAWRSLWAGLKAGFGVYDMASEGVIKRETKLPLRVLEI